MEQPVVSLALEGASDKIDTIVSLSRPGVTAVDVRSCYFVFLGRPAENDDVVNDKVGLDGEEVIAAFVSSPEFGQDVVPALLDGTLYSGRYTDPPTASLKHWIASFAPLSPDGVTAVIAAQTWPVVLGAILADPDFQARFRARNIQLPDLREGLASGAQIHGQSGPPLGSEPSWPSGDRAILLEWTRLAEGTGLFDAEHYRERIAALPPHADPLHHYLTAGYRSYFSPGPDFDEVHFLALQPQARQQAIPGLVQYALLSAADQADFRRREHAALETRGWVSWQETGGLLPDSDIAVARLRGFSFFERFGFLFEGDAEPSHALAAAEALAAQTPDIKSGVDAQPEASVVIPAYGQLPFVLSCLESLAQQRSRYSFEVLVYDDCSIDEELMGLLRLIPWITYVRGAKNLGFLRACNAAAKLCRGEHIVLLNSDVRVAPDWLQELIGTFTAHPLAGFVGSKLFNPDGTLQEAGGVIWPDATGCNVGRDDDPNRPQYCYARQVDYCSGAAIAIPTKLWRELGGFDEAYAPAYYEDTDLAFRIRKASLQVWYQPLARAIHYEGRTHGRDLQTGVKAHQRVNEAVFRQVWAQELAGHFANRTPLLKAADRFERQRLLVLDANVLTPDKDSGSITTLRLIEMYQSLGWSITFAGLHNLGYDPDYSARLQRMGVEVVYAPFIGGIDALLDYRADFDAVLGLRHNVLYPVYETLRRRLTMARILFHNMDLHHLRMERQAALTNDRRMRSLAEAAHDEESFLAVSADCTLVTSHAEEAIIRQEIGGDARLVTYAYTMEVNAAVRPRSTRFDVLFFGGYQHTPNVDAAELLVGEIWPLLVDRLPAEARLVLAGSEMPERVRRLAGERIVVLGFVPDLRETMEDARVFAVPLRYGAGVKGKLVTALANGLPAVGSGIAVEGMGLEHGRDALVANSPAEFAEALLQLYEDEALWASIQAEGYRFVEREYSREAGLDRCREALEKADKHWLEGRRRRRELMLAELRQSW